MAGRSAGGVQGDGVAEGFELPDEAVEFAVGVDAFVVVVRAEVVVAGVGVGEPRIFRTADY